ncbi:hypothetical protein SteCoe_12047 [Stentor coeruleus]|uniref:Uncharacterized protein n=1 Tax=Stentor coeruleus TaxID=5963 RepID=A0A1R2CBU3_9CILI|nr:hypothetical protein SteCoe_12047 [Stentor coeruleus]
MSSLSFSRNNLPRAVKLRIEKLQFSPYLQPVRNKSFSKSGTRLVLHKKQSHWSMPECDLEKLCDGALETFSGITETDRELPITLTETNYENKSLGKFSLNPENFMSIIDEKLKFLKPTEYRKRFKVFLSFLDQILKSEQQNSVLFIYLIQNLLHNIKSHYKEKINTCKQSLHEKSFIIETLGIEKEKNIQKLSELSIQNLKLLSSNEELSKRIRILADGIKDLNNSKGNPLMLHEELKSKNEIIKNLNKKVHDLTVSEKKIYRVLEKIRENMDIEKYMSMIPSKKLNYKNKMPSFVPLLKIDSLFCIKGENVKDSN